MDACARARSPRRLRPGRRRADRPGRCDPDARRRGLAGGHLPAGGRRSVPGPRLSDAIRQALRGRKRSRSPESRRARLCGRPSGRARPLCLGWDLRTLSPRRRGRLRHDRVGRGPALVHRQDRHLRPFLPRRRAVAGRDGGAAASRRHGAGDDLFVAPQIFLHERHLRLVVAAVDLPVRRSGCASPAWTSGRRGCGEEMARRRAGISVVAAAA